MATAPPAPLIETDIEVAEAPPIEISDGLLGAENEGKLDGLFLSMFYWISAELCDWKF